MDSTAVSEHTLEVLRQAGWHPSRRVEVEERWIEPLEKEGFRAFEAAREVLREFGGLKVDPPERNELPYFRMQFEFDPCGSAQGEFDRMEDFEKKAKEPLFPLGDAYDFRFLLIGESGKVYIGDQIWSTERKEYDQVVYLWGESIEEALEYLISKLRPLEKR